MAALLAIKNAHEANVLIDALVALANEIEADPEGDLLGYVPIADELAGRLRELRTLHRSEAEQVMKMIGLGRFQDRPQG